MVGCRPQRRRGQPSPGAAAACPARSRDSQRRRLGGRRGRLRWPAPRRHHPSHNRVPGRLGCRRSGQGRGVLRAAAATSAPGRTPRASTRSPPPPPLRFLPPGRRAHFPPPSVSSPPPCSQAPARRPRGQFTAGRGELQAGPAPPRAGTGPDAEAEGAQVEVSSAAPGGGRGVVRRNSWRVSLRFLSSWVPRAGGGCAPLGDPR